MYSTTGWSDRKIMALLASGGDLEEKDWNGQTMLHMSCWDGNLDVVIDLLNRGAEIDARDNHSRSPLHYASAHGFLDVAMELINRGADIEAVDKDLATPLLYSCRHGHVSILCELMNEGATVDAYDKDGQTPFSWACACGKLECVQELLSRDDIDIERADGKGLTPLHWACRNGHYDVVMELLDADCDIEPRTLAEETPLHFAALFGDKAILIELLDEGADINAKNKNGETALNIACTNHHLSVVLELLRRGAVAKSKYKDVDPLMQWAREYGHIAVVIELFKRGVPIPYRQKVNGILIERYILQYIDQSSGDTLLHIAIRRGYKHQIDSILSAEEHPVISKDTPKPSMIQNKEGLLPIALAWEKYDHYTVGLLIEALRPHTKEELGRIIWILDYHRGLYLRGSDVRFLLDTQYPVGTRMVHHIHFLGDSYAGKTTAIKSFCESVVNPHMRQCCGLMPQIIRTNIEDRTTGVVIRKFDVSSRRRVIYDYGGHQLFHMNQTKFLAAPSSLYVIVLSLWDYQAKRKVELPYLYKQYRYWLKIINSIPLASHHNKVHIITIINGYDSLSLMDRYASFTNTMKETFIEELKTIQREFSSRMSELLNLIDIDTINHPMTPAMTKPMESDAKEGSDHVDNDNANMRYTDLTPDDHATSLHRPYTPSNDLIDHEAMESHHIMREDSANAPIFSMDTSLEGLIGFDSPNSSVPSTPMPMKASSPMPETDSRDETPLALQLPKHPNRSRSNSPSRMNTPIDHTMHVPTNHKGQISRKEFIFLDVPKFLNVSRPESFSIEMATFTSGEDASLHPNSDIITHILEDTLESIEKYRHRHNEENLEERKLFHLFDFHQLILSTYCSHIDYIPTTHATKFMICRLVCDHLHRMGEILVITIPSRYASMMPSRAYQNECIDPSYGEEYAHIWVCIDPNWLTIALLSIISHNIQLYKQTLASKHRHLRYQLTSALLNDMTKDAYHKTALQYVYGLPIEKEALLTYLHFIPLMLMSLGFCIPYDDLPTDQSMDRSSMALTWLPIFLIKKNMNKSSYPMNKRFDIFADSLQENKSFHRMIMHRFVVRKSSLYSFLPGFFMSLFAKVISSLSSYPSFEERNKDQSMTLTQSSRYDFDEFEIFHDGLVVTKSILTKNPLQDYHMDSYMTHDMMEKNSSNSSHGVNNAMKSGHVVDKCQIIVQKDVQLKNIKDHDEVIESVLVTVAMIRQHANNTSKSALSSDSPMESQLSYLDQPIDVSLATSHAWNLFTRIRNLILYGMKSFHIDFDDYGVDPFSKGEKLIPSHGIPVERYIDFLEYEYGVNGFKAGVKESNTNEDSVKMTSLENDTMNSIRKQSSLTYQRMDSLYDNATEANINTYATFDKILMRKEAPDVMYDLIYNDTF